MVNTLACKTAILLLSTAYLFLIPVRHYESKTGVIQYHLWFSEFLIFEQLISVSLGGLEKSGFHSIYILGNARNSTIISLWLPFTVWMICCIDLQVMKTWPLTTVRRWAASPNSFTLVGFFQTSCLLSFDIAELTRHVDHCFFSQTLRWLFL